MAIFAVGKAPTNGQAFDEAMYTVSGGLALAAGTVPSATGPVRYTAVNRPNSGPNRNRR